MRYEIRNGKFGPYYHDCLKGKDLSMRQVVDLLNGQGGSKVTPKAKPTPGKGRSKMVKIEKKRRSPQTA